MTYLEAVNEVLTRLRESSVLTVTQTAYSSLIGVFVNDAKRQVEDAFNWDALSTTLTFTTVSGTSNYTVTGTGLRFKDADVNDTTNQAKIRNVPIKWIQDQQQLSQVQNGQPCYFAWNGTDGTDAKMELYPTPDGAYTIKVNLYVMQAKLTSDSTSISILPDAVVMFAYARALAERGEDGGLASSEAYGLAKGILADQIAIESGRFVENDCWVAN